MIIIKISHKKLGPKHEQTLNYLEHVASFKMGCIMHYAGSDRYNVYFSDININKSIESELDYRFLTENEKKSAIRK